MKKTTLLFLFLIIGYYSFSQFIIKIKIKEEIPNICNQKEIYVFLKSENGQEEPICSVGKDIILEKLNSEVVFLKENSNYNDKGMVNLIINCKGELVLCRLDKKTQSEELDIQIINVFKSLGSWQAGKLYGVEVDTSKLFNFKIANSQFIFD